MLNVVPCEEHNGGSVIARYEAVILVVGYGPTIWKTIFEPRKTSRI
jgi:hypothetical protein